MRPVIPDVKISSLEKLPQQHRMTDDAAIVEFDFRCKIKDAYVIIDMQQWYKPDIVQRFYLYHALNSGLQLETPRGIPSGAPALVQGSGNNQPPESWFLVPMRRMGTSWGGTETSASVY